MGKEVAGRKNSSFYKANTFFVPEFLRSFAAESKTCSGENIGKTLAEIFGE